MPLRPSLIAAALLAASRCACAAPDLADAPIGTDRPDFVESSQVVGKGRLQIESSVALERDGSGAERQTVWATPTLLRFGITRNIELRVESDGALRQRTGAAGTPQNTERGYADTSLGLKWHLADAAGKAPSLGLLLHSDLSTGSALFRGQGTRPSARIVAEWDLPGDMSLGVMPGVGYEKSGDRHAYGIFGVVVGKAWTHQVRSLIELSSAHIARTSRGGSEARLSVGAAYLLKRNMQIDMAVSRGLNNRTADLGLTFGLSYKL